MSYLAATLRPRALRIRAAARLLASVDEPAQADVEHAHPLWKTWRGTDRLCHALRREGAALQVWGEDWLDLSHQIVKAEAHLEEARPLAWRPY